MPSVDSLILILYLKGASTGDMSERKVDFFHGMFPFLDRLLSHPAIPESLDGEGLYCWRASALRRFTDKPKRPYSRFSRPSVKQREQPRASEGT